MTIWKWKCESCGAEGGVFHPELINASSVEELQKKLSKLVEHSALSPRCPGFVGTVSIPIYNNLIKQRGAA